MSPWSNLPGRLYFTNGNRLRQTEDDIEWTNRREWVWKSCCRFYYTISVVPPVPSGSRGSGKMIGGKMMGVVPHSPCGDKKDEKVCLQEPDSVCVVLYPVLG